jgi:hypothetical protein
MIYFCCEDRRRSAVQRHPTLNGIDFLEVIDRSDEPQAERQRILLLHFIKDLAPGSLDTQNIRIEGGERISNIVIVSLMFGGVTSPPLFSPPIPSDPKVLAVEVDQPGDFSTYTLRLILSPDNPDLPPSGFDPILSSVDFSFKVACPQLFDCRTMQTCPPAQVIAPEIDYLAKDFSSFRQLMLDRLATVIPSWNEDSIADLGIVLVELIAFVADYLSYEQDAVETEAYIGTARRRVSVRRHARLVDYSMNDGSNARTWVYFEVRSDVPSVPLKQGDPGARTVLLTQTSVSNRVLARNSSQAQKALDEAHEALELMQDATLFSAHNRIPFYTWGDIDCCLPKGATKATLNGSFPNLQVGDVLVFEEVLGPKTGAPEDADPAHRCAVRLTKVQTGIDPLGGEFLTSPSSGPTPITNIEWGSDDALPFPVCISARNGTLLFLDVSIARGNIVLADHGLTTASPEMLDPVPQPNPMLSPVAVSGGHCDQTVPLLKPARFRPVLKQSPITQAAPLVAGAPAATSLATSPADATPSIFLTGPGGDQDIWRPQRDLLRSGPEAKEFVVEVENDGSATLRFGDGQFGLRPAAGTEFAATYRVGNGTNGNIGADSLFHIVSSDPAIIGDLFQPVITRIRNPLPATGGIEQETIDQATRSAPSAFRIQERAVTAQDYADKAKVCAPDIQNATATFRWTGSWRTVFLTIDREGNQLVDAAFIDGLRSCLEQFRMAGQDLEVDAPSFVSLEIEIVVCIKTGYFRSDVVSALSAVLSNSTLPNGQKGVFHPDNFSFGQTVYLSPVVAAAQAVDGVASVNVTKFRRQGDASQTTVPPSIQLGRLEIARLDADPNFPERGTLAIIPQGGQ